jgi:hypothetical protein
MHGAACGHFRSCFKPSGESRAIKHFQEKPARTKESDTGFPAEYPAP